MLQLIDLNSQDLAVEFFSAVEFNNALEEANANADEYGLTGRLRDIYVNRFMLDADTLEDWLASRASQRLGFSMF